MTAIQSVATSLLIAIGVGVAAMSCAPDVRANGAPEPEAISVIGDSWCSGLEWGGAGILDLHCDNGSTTRDWRKSRIKKLDLEQVVYFQLGVNDYLRWYAKDGQRWNSKWAARKAAKRLRRVVRWLEKQGHEVYVLDYQPLPPTAVPQQLKNLCAIPGGKLIFPGALHLTPESYKKRAWFLLEGGCHQ